MPINMKLRMPSSEEMNMQFKYTPSKRLEKAHAILKPLLISFLKEKYPNQYKYYAPILDSKPWFCIAGGSVLRSAMGLESEDSEDVDFDVYSGFSLSEFDWEQPVLKKDMSNVARFLGWHMYRVNPFSRTEFLDFMLQNGFFDWRVQSIYDESRCDATHYGYKLKFVDETKEEFIFQFVSHTDWQYEVNERTMIKMIDTFFDIELCKLAYTGGDKIVVVSNHLQKCIENKELLYRVTTNKESTLRRLEKYEKLLGFKSKMLE